MMKRIKMVFAVMLFATGAIFMINTSDVSATELDIAVEETNYEELTFEELPENEKNIFLENGYTEEDTFFKYDLVDSSISRNET